MIADRRIVVLALCAVLALKSAASAAGFGEAGFARATITVERPEPMPYPGRCPEGTRREFDEYTGRCGCVPNEPVIRPLGDRPNDALGALRAGAWGERNDDSFRVVAAGWETPNLGQNLTPPNLTPQNQWSPTPAPVPVEIRPIEAARAVEPAVAFPAYSYVEPCRDLREKAARLRAAANQCYTDLANGRPSCSVEVTFSTPRIPRRLSPSDARWYASDFEARVVDADERTCKDYGGEGAVPVNGGDPGPTQAYARWYKRLCDQGDEYACDARQITLLCFDNSYVNSCVRRCLVDNDSACVATNDPAAKLDCRRKNHWLCYEASCPKIVPSPNEVACFSRFKKWKNFLLPPGLSFGGGY